MSQHPTPTPTLSRWPHRVAVLLVCVTFPLIWVGGLVTTYDAGMAVQDWPSTYGYNLFLYPWTTWIFGPFDLFIEHGHRLLGALAGIVTIVLVICTWIFDRRQWVRNLAMGALLLVCLQGALGGARVIRDERLLAMVHGCVGPLFFAYCCVLAVVTSRRWIEGPLPQESVNGKLLRLLLLTSGLVYLQLVLGAQIRHVAADAAPTTFRIAVIFHVGVAFVVLAHGIAVLLRSRDGQLPAAIRRPARILGSLVLLQIALGASVWVLKFGWPFGLNERFQFATSTVVEGSMLQAMTTTAHVAVGSLILAFSVVAAMHSYRLFRARSENRGALLKSVPKDRPTDTCIRYMRPTSAWEVA